MGPYHPGLEEPYKLDMICEGETVVDAQLHIGFNLRGIEHLAETRNFIQVNALMERVCGICSFIHTLTLCQAMEPLAGVEAPPRAKYIRVIMAELERLHSHVLWAGIAAKLMGFKTMFMTCFELREQVMDILQAISGNRVNYSMNRVGGVNRDIEDPAAILKMVEALEKAMVKTVIPIFTTSHTALSRCTGIGVLTHEKAIECGVVGPIARASGIPQDIRKAAPYAAYAELDFDVPVQQSGDVKARLLVRALEIMESCKILRQALQQLPPGEIDTGDDRKIRFTTGTSLSRVEAPRGEVVYSVSFKEGQRNPARIHVRTPTYATMPSVRWMVQGARLADTPLIQASIDPCYSCTDR
jgi:Ni,Fe-hydrogenase III large subunit